MSSGRTAPAHPRSPASDQRAPRSGEGAAAAVLIALMALASVIRWVGAPLFWLRVGSQLQEGATPSLGPYVVLPARGLELAALTGAGAWTVGSPAWRIP